MTDGPPGDAYREAAVLVPLVRDAARVVRLVVVRRTAGGVHGGQLAFPGGRVEPGDTSAFAAACREADEEIGLPPASVRVLAELPAVSTRVSGYRVRPFVAVAPRPAAWRPAPEEIAEVLEPDLARLLAPGALEHANDLLPPDWAAVRLPFYRVGDYRLWGLSERILTPLLARIGAGEWRAELVAG